MKGYDIAASKIIKESDPGGRSPALKILVTVFLLAIIAVSVVMLINVLGSDTAGDSGADRGLRRLKCTKCGHEFEISSRDFNLQHKDAKDSIPGMGHCPKCKGRFCSARMNPCPHCKQLIAKAVPGKGDNAGKLVCPKCNKVVGESDVPRR